MEKIRDSDRLIANDFLRCMTGIGAEVLKMRECGIATEDKTSFQDVVTAADRYSEFALTKHVEATFPFDGVRGEEGTRLGSSSGYEWIFDSIDGTTIYASGLPFFGISAGRVNGNLAVIGALLFPALGEFFFAVLGRGAFVQKGGADFMPIPKFPTPQRLKDAVIALDVIHQNRADLIPVFSAACRSFIKCGSFVYEAMLVAQGQVAAHVNGGATPFDIAAAVVIAEESGCIVSALDGGPIDLSQEKIPIVIAANADIHAEIITLCSRG